MSRTGLDTKTNWEVRGTAIVLKGTSETIADVRVRARRNRDWKADAALIALAPELLAALRFWFPDKEDSRARSFPGEWERDAKLLERLK